MSFICLQADVFANKVSLDPDAIDHVRKVSMESDVSKLASLALQVSNQTEKKKNHKWDKLLLEKSGAVYVARWVENSLVFENKGF